MKEPVIYMTETTLTGEIKKLAEKYFNWKYYHTWTSMHSPRGYPDCVLLKPPRIIFAELKTDKKTSVASPAQEEWLDILEQIEQNEVYLWRPRHLERIAQILQEQPKIKIPWREWDL